MKKTLVLQDGIYAEIVRLAREFKGLEFAITLFGSIRNERFEVTHFAPPGRNAEHAHGRCTNDHEFESDVFDRLRKEVPGIQYIGDLHAHPPVVSQALWNGLCDGAADAVRDGRHATPRGVRRGHHPALA
jgi:hypothetical protein